MKVFLIFFLCFSSLFANQVQAPDHEHRNSWYSSFERYLNHFAFSSDIHKEDFFLRLSLAQSLIGRQNLVVREHIVFRPYYKSFEGGLEEFRYGFGASLQQMLHFPFVSIYGEAGATYFLGDYSGNSEHPEWKWVIEYGGGIQIPISSSNMLQLGYIHTGVWEEANHRAQVGLLFGF